MTRSSIQKIIFSLAVLAFPVCAALGIFFLTLQPTTAQADTPHTDHAGWTELTASLVNSTDGKAAGELAAGSYYLNSDVTLSGNDITIPSDATVTLCLNGHMLRGTGTQSVVTVWPGATFHLCDCNSSNGSHDYYLSSDDPATTSNEGGKYLFDDGTDAWDTAYAAAGEESRGAVTGGVITGGIGTNSNDYYYPSWNGSYVGGGVYVMRDGATFNMTGGTIAGNSAQNGSGVFVYFGSTMTMTGGAISGNHYISPENHNYNAGGGIFVQGGTVKLSGGVISENVNQIGGGIHVSTPAGGYEKYPPALELSGTIEIKDNIANSWGGGIGVYCGTITMTGGSITGNTVRSISGDGGGIDLIGSYINLKISGGTISGNSAGTYGDGNAIHVDGSAVVQLSGNPTIDGDDGDNNVSDNADIYIWQTGSTLRPSIEITGELTNEQPYEVYSNKTGIISAGWSTYMSGKAVAGYFNTNSSSSYEITVYEGELQYAPKNEHWHNTQKFEAFEFTPVSNNSGPSIYQITTSGYYYLADDFNPDQLYADSLFIGNGTDAVEVYLCLNGYALSVQDIDNALSGSETPNSSAIVVNPNATLHICDCGGLSGIHSEGVVKGGKGTRYQDSSEPANTYTFGGGALVFGTMYLEGGTITGNTADYGGGVYVADGGKFVMTGGTISNNSAQAGGPSVMTEATGEGTAVLTPVKPDGASFDTGIPGWDDGGGGSGEAAMNLAFTGGADFPLASPQYLTYNALQLPKAAGPIFAPTYSNSGTAATTAAVEICGGYLSGDMAGGGFTIQAGYFAAGTAGTFDTAGTIGTAGTVANDYAVASGSFVMEISSLGTKFDGDFVSDFPYAVYIYGDANLTGAANETDPTFDGNEIVAGTDFTVSAAYDLSDAIGLAYSYMENNQSRTGLPAGVGTWSITMRTEIVVLPDANGVKTYYPADSTTFAVTIGPCKHSSYTVNPTTNICNDCGLHMVANAIYSGQRYYFSDLREAIEAAETNDATSVYLIADNDLSQPSPMLGMTGGVTISKTIILSFNGSYTLSAPGSGSTITVSEGATLTVANAVGAVGTIAGDVTVNSDASFTMEGGYLTGSIVNNSGTVAIRGGYFAHNPTDYVASGYTAINLSADTNHYGDENFVEGCPYAVYVNGSTSSYSARASNITYGETVVPTLNNPNNVTVTYSYTVNDQTYDALPTNAGTYTVKAIFSAFIDGANKTYYPQTEKSFTVKIGKYILAASNVSWTYTNSGIEGGSEQALRDSVTYNGSAYTVSASISGIGNDGKLILNVTGGERGNAFTNAGTGSYILSAALSEGDYANYAFTTGGARAASKSVTVGKATLTVRAENKIVTYGDAAPAYTVSYSGFVNDNDNESDLITVPTATSDYTVGTGVSSSGMPITVSGGADDNYTFNYIDGTLTILPKNISSATIELGAPLTYNGREQTQEIASVTADGLTVTYAVLSGSDKGTDAKNYTLTIQGSGNFSGTATKEWSIATKDISDATIELGASLTYNGREQTQEIASVTADGLTVTYAVLDGSDKGTDAKSYTLTIQGSGNFSGTATKAWSIAKRALTSDLFTVTGSYTYDGTAQEATYTVSDTAGNLTANDFSVAYKNNVRAGNTASIVFTATEGGNYSGEVQLSFTIAKAVYDMSGISFEDASYVYDGTAKTLVITGTLPAGVTVSYSANSLTNVDSLEVTATFTGDADNYETIPSMTATLTITQAAYDISGITLEDATVTYDGQPHTLKITGTLPSGVTVTYENNGQTAAGSYIITAILTGSDESHPIHSMTATLTIEKATYDMSGVTFENATYTYDGSEKTLAIGGVLPAGVTVEYTTNTLIEAGSLGVTATFTGDAENYEAISPMTATLTIEKATPEYTKPEGITAIVGQTLDEIALPEGWSWTDGSLTLNEEGETVITAVYTPEDTENYNPVTVEVTVTVEPAGLSDWVIVLITVVSIAAVVGIIIIILFARKKKKEDEEEAK